MVPLWLKQGTSNEYIHQLDFLVVKERMQIQQLNMLDSLLFFSVLFVSLLVFSFTNFFGIIASFWFIFYCETITND